MRADHSLQVMFSGHGHWKITTTHYGKTISTVTTNSQAIDDYKDDDQRLSNRGKRELRNEIIRNNQNKS
jgi:hypothetical protein